MLPLGHMPTREEGCPYRAVCPEGKADPMGAMLPQSGGSPKRAATLIGPAERSLYDMPSILWAFRSDRVAPRAGRWH